MTMNRLVDSVRFTGHIGVSASSCRRTRRARRTRAQRQDRLRHGQILVQGPEDRHRAAQRQTYNRQLRDLIHEGRAKPSWIISHELPLAEAESGYQHFDARDDGWTKVVLHP